LLFKNISNKYSRNNQNYKNYIDGEFEDKDEDK